MKLFFFFIFFKILFGYKILILPLTHFGDFKTFAIIGEELVKNGNNVTIGVSHLKSYKHQPYLKKMNSLLMESNQTEQSLLETMEKQNKFPIGIYEHSKNLIDIVKEIRKELQSNLNSKSISDFLQNEKPDLVIIHQVFPFLTQKIFKNLLNQFKFKYIVIHVIYINYS
jgi:hypothetical protein